METFCEEPLKGKTFEEKQEGYRSQPMEITNMEMARIFSITSDIFQVVQLVTITFHHTQYTSDFAQFCMYLLTDHNFSTVHWILN
jgi:hypothetical protein